MAQGHEETEPGTRPIVREAVDPSLLYAQHSEELRRFVVGVMGNRDLVGDVMQATFIKVVEKGHVARAESFKPWLFRVALNECLMLRRRDDVGERARRQIAARRPDRAPGPQEHLIRDEVIERVRELVAQLPPDHRSVVLARMYEEKTFAQIADEQGLPIGTVLTRMRRALQRLRGDLQAGDGLP